MAKPDACGFTIDCMCCRDSGLVGGADYPAAFCKCPAGVKLQAENPKAADEANNAVKRLNSNIERAS